MLSRPGLAVAVTVLAAACVPPDTTPSTVSAPSGEHAEVVAVSDGDSFIARFDGTEVEVRLVGVNAPERSECLGPESADALAALIQGRAVTIPAAGERDQFDRLLAVVVVDGTDVNRAQVEAGMALALTPAGPGEADYRVAEEQAWSARTGMWSPGACGAGPLPEVRVVEVEADPPGPDDQRLDEEAVVIENSGGTAVALGGWVLRDESSANRFPFPDGLLLAPGDQTRVVTGCAAGARRLAWCAGSPVWNNAGDTALLLDPAGRVVDRFRYSSG
jgi:endonuclease YncB( thermonuclease family)